mgnify:CR=1 FL=1
MGTAWFCTRERVARALDADHTAYRTGQIDQAIDAGARLIEAQLHWQDIAPTRATHSFDWPNTQTARAWRLWLDNQGLISFTAVTTGGQAITPLAEPVNEGPPYTSLNIDLAGSSSWQAGTTWQRSIGVAGLWGLGDDRAPAGALAEALETVGETEVDVTDGSLVGVGTILRAGTEDMIVTGRAWLDSGQNPTGSMAADTAVSSFAVADGTQLHAGENVILDAEEMRVHAVTGNTVIVERAVNGTVLGAHTTASDVYVPRRLTVARGAQGSTAITHLIGATLTAWDPPALIEALNVAVAMDQIEQELGAYSREIRSGDSAAPATGSGLEAKWTAARNAHGRQARVGAI